MDFDKTEIPTAYDKALALAPEPFPLWRELMRNLVKSSPGCIQAARNRVRSRFSAALDWRFRISLLLGLSIREH
jgi:hypothetical protein